MTKREELIKQITQELDADTSSLESKVFNLSEADNRKQPRTEMLHPMMIIDPATGNELDSNCINISLGGLLLYCFEGNFEIDHDYHVNVKPTENTPEFTVNVKLVRLVFEENGHRILGLKFNSLSEEQAQFLNKISE